MYVHMYVCMYVYNCRKSRLKARIFTYWSIRANLKQFAMWMLLFSIVSVLLVAGFGCGCFMRNGNRSHTDTDPLHICNISAASLLAYLAAVITVPTAYADCLDSQSDK